LHERGEGVSCRCVVCIVLASFGIFIVGGPWKTSREGWGTCEERQRGQQSPLYAAEPVGSDVTCLKELVPYLDVHGNMSNDF
jgi:hypothetical protein